MGAVHFSIDVSLVELLRRSLPLEVFVETGTFKGDSIQQVRSLFRELYTVETSVEFFGAASERFKSDPAIQIFNDSSARVLRKLMPCLDGRSVLYWLDAHGCGEDLTMDGPQCPLLQELEAIGQLNEDSVLLIDDARLFLAPPPPPHCPEQWPSLDLVIEGLRSLSTAHEMLVLNDVFVYFPLSVRSDLRDFASLNAIDWLRVLDKARDYDDVLARFQQIGQDAQEKEKQIQSLVLEAKAKDVEIESLALDARGKDIEIQNLTQQAAEKEVEIQRQHADIMRLLRDMSALRRSKFYRLGFALLNPWNSINQKFLKRS